jgi:hypothetical protein
MSAETYPALTGILVLVAGILAIAGRYPPLRLDMDGSEPGGRLSVPPAGPGAGPGPAAGQGPAAGPGAYGYRPAPPPPPGPPPPPSPPPASAGWTAGRVIALVAGSVLALISLSLLAGGGALVWAGQTQRQAGYLTSGARTYATGGYALATEPASLQAGPGNWAASLIGKIRIRVSTPGTARPVFVGIAPAGAARRYLSGVPYTTVARYAGSGQVTVTHQGSASPAAPQAAGIWAAQTAGTGPQTLTWTARDGDWMLVVMNRDPARGLTVRADAGATFPGLPWVAGGLLAGGVLLAAGGVLLIVLPARRASARRVPAAWSGPA